MSMRIASVFGAFLNCIWKLNLNEYQNGIRVWSVSKLYLKRFESEWVSRWHPCLERIWTVSESWIWMSVRMASMSGAYLNCIGKLTLNEYQNGIHVWSVSELYQKVWIWMSIRMASMSGVYLNCIRKLWTMLMIAVNLILKRVKC